MGDRSIKEQHQGDFFSGLPQKTFENTCASLARCQGAMAKALLLGRGKGRPGEGELGSATVLILIGHSGICFPILEPTQRPRTVCERWRESLLEHYGGTPRDDQYVPQCDHLGHFVPLQCHGKSDFCWCVDRDGRELQGTRSQPGTTPACKHGMARELLCVIEVVSSVGVLLPEVGRVGRKRVTKSNKQSPHRRQVSLPSGSLRIPIWI